MDQSRLIPGTFVAIVVLVLGGIATSRVKWDGTVVRSVLDDLAAAAGITDVADPPGDAGAHERCSSASLKTLSVAEADFRANDRDWCSVNDFWTGDVVGLYTLTSAAVSGEGSAKDPSILLIELSVAAVDEETP